MTEYSAKIEIEEEDLLDLIHWARRYCDKRCTGVAHQFNGIYKRLRSAYPDLLRTRDLFDKTLMNNSEFWPYAQDGDFKDENGGYDAR
jgi:hypothetical protein